MKRDFISISDINEAEFWQILKLAKRIKNKQGLFSDTLENKTLVMIFEKPSLRTRLSFEVGMTQLGGHAVYLAPTDVGLGVRESVADVAKVVSSMGDLIMARVFKHDTVLELARQSRVPVINGLSDLEHPCQILADLMTVWEHFGKLKSLKLAYVGDCENNVTHSLALGCALVGMGFVAAGPKGYHIASSVQRLAPRARQIVDPAEAVRGADVVVTDTWISMGDEAEKAKRLKIFKPYQVNQSLMKLAKKSAVFLHCLPAYRGNEVTAEVIDGPQSLVWDEAENRLHVQKALMVWLLKQVKNTK